MTVVLLHPFPFDHRMWAEVVDLLGRADVLVPDLLGCGGRTAPTEPPSLATVAHDVWQQVGSGSAPVVIGISLGGYVAFEMLRQRSLAGLGLIDTKCTADTDVGRVNRERLAATMEGGGRLSLYAEQSLPALLGSHTLQHRPAVVARVRSWIEQANPATVAWLARAMAMRPDSTADLAGFREPVLLVRGEQDSIATAQDYAVMSAVAPQAKTEVIAGCGHLPPAEDPAATAAVLRSWLSRY